MANSPSLHDVSVYSKTFLNVLTKQFLIARVIFSCLPSYTLWVISVSDLLTASIYLCLVGSTLSFSAGFFVHSIYLNVTSEQTDG